MKNSHLHKHHAAYARNECRSMTHVSPNLPEVGKTSNQTRTLLVLTAALAVLALASSVRAATFSSSATAPLVDATDIANLAPQTGSYKWWFQSANEVGVTDAAKGQTFTNGASAMLLKALTYKIDPTQKKTSPTTYNFRVGNVSETSFTLVAIETCTQTTDTAVGAYQRSHGSGHGRAAAEQQVNMAAVTIAGEHRILCRVRRCSCGRHDKNDRAGVVLEGNIF